MMKQKLYNLIHTIADGLSPLYENQEEREQVSWWLLEKLLQLNKVQLIARKEIELNSVQEQQLAQWVHEHVVEYKPLQYILGTVPFCNLSLLVEAPILIARPETEEWCMSLIEQLMPLQSKQFTILDLCTGSGCIALALAQAFPQSSVIGIDISPQACALAQKNAQFNNIHNVVFMQSDLYEQIPVDMKFDVIVTNPPYIAEKFWPTLSESVRQWEDKNALIAQSDGLALISKIIQKAPHYLNKKTILSARMPRLIIEIDDSQGTIVQELCIKFGFKNSSILKDLAGKERVVTGIL